MYGKWAQRARRWVNVHDQPNGERWESWWQPHPESGDPVPWRAIAGIVQYQDCSEESKLACPAIGAFMASYGRAYLFTVMSLAGLENVHYWDTDSVMVNDDGMDKLDRLRAIDPAAFGLLKIREQSDDVELFGVKHYRFGQRYVCSGVSVATDERLHGSVRVEEHASFNDGLWHKRRGEAKRVARNRARARKYNQGRVLRDGTVVPFTFTSREIGADNAV
jgi:hypothetical protein